MSVRTQNGHGRTDISVYCTYKLKWKPLFDGKAMLYIQGHYRGALPGKPLCPSVPKMGPDGQTCPSVPKLGTDGHPVTKVTTGHQKWPKMGQNSIKSPGHMPKPFIRLLLETFLCIQTDTLFMFLELTGGAGGHTGMSCPFNSQ